MRLVPLYGVIKETPEIPAGGPPCEDSEETPFMKQDEGSHQTPNLLES